MPATVQPPVPGLQTHVQTSLIDLQRQVWKARGQAKQKWLEQALAQPVKNPRDAEKRASWIESALSDVKTAQEEIKYQAALLDAYAEHLSVLEMSLMAAGETPPASSPTPSADPVAEPTRRG